MKALYSALDHVGRVLTRQATTYDVLMLSSCMACLAAHYWLSAGIAFGLWALRRAVDS